jgi:PAS domain S-box-containing protein
MYSGQTNIDPGRPAVVLNVDDNPASLYAKSRTLRRAGFHVLEATNGEDALQIVDREAPSLVLLDVQLPDMSGLEVCRRIKAAPATYLLPVLHISATYKSDLIKEESQESGADIYLVEPVSGEELITVVRTLLRLRRSELGLAESETRLRLATEGAQIATWDLDLRTGEAVWSSRLHELLGYPADSKRATWQMWRSRIHPDDVAAVDEALDAAKAGRELFQCEHRVLPADGSAERWLAPRGRIYPDPQGNNTRVIGVATDVTVRRRMDEERERLFALEQAARADAEHAARLKDQFLATLSHELRNPMSAVLGWLHLLRGGRLSAPQAEQALETIERNARLQNQLINDILDVSRIITGQFRLELAPLRVIPVLNDAIETVRPAAAAKSIAIDLDLGAVDSWVQGDAGRLQQVFINLLGNAIKFSAAHTRIRIASSQRDQMIVVAVADQGEGISADVLPHIFERFRQADG